jgi:hypothetical protein
MIFPVRVAGFAGMVGGKLGRYRLAHNDGAGFPQRGDTRGIACRFATRMDEGAIFRWHITCVDHILDANQHTAQRAGGASFLMGKIGKAGLFLNISGVQKGKGLHTLFALCHRSQRSLRYRFRGRLAQGETPGIINGSVHVWLFF